MPKLFCFGYGYTADFLAQALRVQGGWDIAGTTRDYEKLELMHAKGIDAHVFNAHEPLADPIEALRGTTHVLISTPADDYGDPSFRFHADDLIHIPTIEWIGYLSTTGVYGDRGGDWVDERSLAQPSSKRGWRRVRAEQQWLDLYESYELPVHIFRLAGIYGPGRNVLDSVRSGLARRINKPGHAFSRIHVEDIVQILMTSMKKPHSGRIYNVADDYPAPSHEVIAYACEMLGERLPPLLDYASADLAPITNSFYADNKRVRNDRIKDELGVMLKYPTFHEGLLACRTAEERNTGTSLPPYWFSEGRDTLAGND